MPEDHTPAPQEPLGDAALPAVDSVGFPQVMDIAKDWKSLAIMYHDALAAEKAAHAETLREREELQVLHDADYDRLSRLNRTCEWPCNHEDYTDWLNDLMVNAGDEWDGDEAMESLVTRYVHGLEAARDQALADLAKSEAGHLIQSGQHVIDWQKLDAALAERDRLDAEVTEMVEAMDQRDNENNDLAEQRDRLREALVTISRDYGYFGNLAKAALATTPSTDD